MSDQKIDLDQLKTDESSGAIIRDPTQVCPMPLEWLPLQKKLDHSIYVRIGERFILFRKAGDMLTKERLHSLLQLRADAIYISRNDWRKVVKQMDQIVNAIQAPEDEASAHKLRDLLVAYEADFEITKRLDADMYNKFSHLSRCLAESFQAHPNLAAKILTRYHDYDLYYANHSVNVAIFCAIIGMRLKLSEKQLQELVLAGLVHNAGNLSIRPSILNKGGPLTENEWTIVKTHTEAGADHLRKLGAPPAVIQTARQHHERIDGHGYPDGLRDQDIHQFAKICTIADVYDALLSTRPHAKQPMNPADAVAVMKEMAGKFDAQIFSLVGDMGAQPKAA